MSIPHTGGPFQTYDISADGQRILTFQRVVNPNSPSTAQVPTTYGIDPDSGFTVAINWPSSLKKN